MGLPRWKRDVNDGGLEAYITHISDRSWELYYERIRDVFLDLSDKLE